MQINVIEFTGQSTHNGWVNPGYATKPTLTKLIGFVTNETDDSLTLTMGFNNFKQDFNVINISKVQIVSRKEYKHLREDSDTVAYQELTIKEEGKN